MVGNEIWKILVRDVIQKKEDFGKLYVKALAVLL